MEQGFAGLEPCILRGTSNGNFNQQEYLDRAGTLGDDCNMHLPHACRGRMHSQFCEIVENGHEDNTEYVESIGDAMYEESGTPQFPHSLDTILSSRIAQALHLRENPSEAVAQQKRPTYGTNQQCQDLSTRRQIICYHA